MLVPESYSLGQGSVHDRKLAPIVVVENAAEAEQVIATHPGQVHGLADGPFYVRFGGPRACSGPRKHGPFNTMKEATCYAARQAGYKRAPTDGWVTVYDKTGYPVMMT